MKNDLEIAGVEQPKCGGAGIGDAPVKMPVQRLGVVYLVFMSVLSFPVHDVGAALILPLQPS